MLFFFIAVWNCVFYFLACGPYEYTCTNLRCIPDSRLCDLHNDCGDDSDEHMCNKQLTTDDILSPPVMVGVVTGCVVFIIIIVFATIIYLTWKRRKRKTTGKNGRIKQIFSHYIAIFDEWCNVVVCIIMKKQQNTFINYHNLRKNNQSIVAYHFQTNREYCVQRF